MKKAIAALLSLFVGMFGYAIVDETIENRVSNLESVVSSQQEEIESLHSIGKFFSAKCQINEVIFFESGIAKVYSEGVLIETREVRPRLANIFIVKGSSENGLVEIYLNDELYYSYRINFRADPPYIISNLPVDESNTNNPSSSISVSDVSNTTKADETSGTGFTLPTTNSNRYIYEGFSLPGRDIQSKYMYRLYSNGEIRYVPTGYYSNQVASTVWLGHSTTTLPDEYDEYFVYVNSSSATVTSIETSSESFTYYDSNYNIQTKVNEKKSSYITVTVSGKADPVFAGKTISFRASIWENGDYSNGTIIDNPSVIIAEDGTFSSTIHFKCGYFINEECYYVVGISNIS